MLLHRLCTRMTNLMYFWWDFFTFGLKSDHGPKFGLVGEYKAFCLYTTHFIPLVDILIMYLSLRWQKSTKFCARIKVSKNRGSYYKKKMLCSNTKSWYYSFFSAKNLHHWRVSWQTKENSMYNLPINHLSRHQIKKCFLMMFQILIILVHGVSYYKNLRFLWMQKYVSDINYQIICFLNCYTDT